jgi:hypothetical protein
MSERTPDLETLVGELDPAERERLGRVHDLLVGAGPPPELSPGLSAPPHEPRGTVIPFPARYRAAALGAAAVIALALLGLGYAIGRGTAREEAFTVPMTGTGGATAEIVVYAKDTAGNWPMELTVRNLTPTKESQRYVLWLTRNGKPVESCGAFVVSGTTTRVPLNAPYRLRDYEGWVVVAEGTKTPVLRTTEI